MLRGIAATLLIAVLGWAQPAMAQWLGGRIIGAPATTQRPDLRQAGPDYWTGYEAARAGDYRCAVEYYTRSLGAPGLRFEVRAAILNDRGVAYARIGDHERAVTDYDAALAITPGDGYALYDRGLARAALGDLDPRSPTTMPRSNGCRVQRVLAARAVRHTPSWATTSARSQIMMQLSK